MKRLMMNAQTHRRQVAVAIKFYRVATGSCGSAVCELRFVTILRISRCLIDFWKICAHLLHIMHFFSISFCFFIRLRLKSTAPSSHNFSVYVLALVFIY